MMRLRKAWSLHKGLFKSPDSSIVLRFYSKKRVGTSAQGAGGEAGGGGVVLPRYIVQGTRGLEVDVGLLDSDMEQTAKALESKFAEFRTGRFPLCIRSLRSSLIVKSPDREYEIAYPDKGSLWHSVLGKAGYCHGKGSADHHCESV